MKMKMGTLVGPGVPPPTMIGGTSESSGVVEPAAEIDEIAGQFPWCILKLPWAPADRVAYVVSRADLQRAQKQLEPDRTYLRSELVFIDQSSAGETDQARTDLFRRMDWLKVRTDGWIIGLGEEIPKMSDVKPRAVIPMTRERREKVQRLQALEKRALAAADYFDRSNAPEAETRPWIGEFHSVLEQIADLRGELAVEE